MGYSLFQHDQLCSVGDEVNMILVKAESWVATRDGPISKCPNIVCILMSETLRYTPLYILTSISCVLKSEYKIEL